MPDALSTAGPSPARQPTEALAPRRPRSLTLLLEHLRPAAGIATSGDTTLRPLRRRSLLLRDHFRRTGGTRRRTHCSETRSMHCSCCKVAEIGVGLFFYPPWYSPEKKNTNGFAAMFCRPPWRYFQEPALTPRQIRAFVCLEGVCRVKSSCRHGIGACMHFC